MANKLKTILLIDDDEPTNFIHKLVIQEAGVCESVIDFQSAENALSYLKTEVDNKYPQPDLIFLDINMPGMNGWEFMEEYETLDPKQKAGMVVVMLTTSMNPDDQTKAHQLGIISSFLRKPLTKEAVLELIEKFF